MNNIYCNDVKEVLKSGAKHVNESRFNKILKANHIGWLWY